MLEIDGSRGEGGGQILRTSLSLSTVTQTPIRLTRIRSNRPRPGLQKQHLASVLAAGQICDAEISGAVIGSREVCFRPGAIRGGDYRFSIDSAGSCMLVLQTVLLPLVLANSPSCLVLEGGTHNPFAPTAHFLNACYLPLLRKMGAQVDLKLERPGFYPAGGGRCIVNIQPSVDGLRPMEFIERGQLLTQSVHSLVSNLPDSIAIRELHEALRVLQWSKKSGRQEQVESLGPGNVLLIHCEFEHASELVSGVGEKGKSAEVVARKAARAMQAYLECGAPIGLYLADQLLLPLALAGGGAMRCQGITEHTLTNMGTIQLFLPISIAQQAIADGTYRIALAKE
ncbi:RNA 3'-terminal phosphate cyclase [Pirellulaceae bacterium SH467]